jgi:hypothetical protein
METFVTVVVLLAMVAVGVLLIHLLNNQPTSASPLSPTAAPARLSGNRRHRSRGRFAVVPERAAPAIAATGDAAGSGHGAGLGRERSESPCFPQYTRQASGRHQQ